jgi:hypothetical protein
MVNESLEFFDPSSVSEQRPLIRMTFPMKGLRQHESHLRHMFKSI